MCHYGHYEKFTANHLKIIERTKVWPKSVKKSAVQPIQVNMMGKILTWLGVLVCISNTLAALEDCACPQEWIGDGTCDTNCNINDCNFDGDDCGTCANDCPSNYLGDNICDEACNNAECNFDRGDCDAISAPPTSAETQLPNIEISGLLDLVFEADSISAINSAGITCATIGIILLMFFFRMKSQHPQYWEQYNAKVRELFKEDFNCLIKTWRLISFSSAISAAIVPTVVMILTSSTQVGVLMLVVYSLALACATLCIPTEFILPFAVAQFPLIASQYQMTWPFALALDIPHWYLIPTLGASLAGISIFFGCACCFGYPAFEFMLEDEEESTKEGTRGSVSSDTSVSESSYTKPVKELPPLPSPYSVTAETLQQPKVTPDSPEPSKPPKPHLLSASDVQITEIGTINGLPPSKPAVTQQQTDYASKTNSAPQKPPKSQQQPVSIEVVLPRPRETPESSNSLINATTVVAQLAATEPDDDIPIAEVVIT